MMKKELLQVYLLITNNELTKLIEKKVVLSHF